MRTAIALTMTTCWLGLLALAGVFSGVQPASAQASGDCVLAAEASPPPPPPSTAQQVEDGSGSVMEFTLAARDALRPTNPAESAAVPYVSCLQRLEGSPWRSGSTYIVSLTADGNVFTHSKNMALSGRQLNPLIYGAILRALGINPADLADPASAEAAFASAIAGNGGPFNVPTIPGASGYAATVNSVVTFGAPLVVIGGFDLNESHLAEEDFDYGDPAITARDVVDRETLKAFVTQAGTYLVDLFERDGLHAVSRARAVLRDENGPWRHGSVYLYMLDVGFGRILFHAAFPDRFENRPLVPTVRDVVTGEFILTQVIEAAQSGPEGGFVQYYFDDPTDDSDRADIPKVGYARQFVVAGEAGGSSFEFPFIVGSGIYLSDPGAIGARLDTVVESVQPQVMRAMTAGMVDAVSGRIEQATADTAPTRELRLGGASTLSDVLLANGPALENGTFDLSRLLANSSFALPLNATGAEGSGPLGDLMFWGSGDYRSFSGGNRETVAYDGAVVSANFGIDARLGADVLAGVGLTHAQGTVDYTDTYAVNGEATTTLTSINPYVGWQASGGMNLWAMAGYGFGEVEIDDDTAAAESSGLTQTMAAAGASGPLMSSDEVLSGGTTSLRLKGEVAFTWADIDGSQVLRSKRLQAGRQRLMLEGNHVRKLSSGASLTPSLELGMRNDGGDGETGHGIETGGGLRYTHSESGLTVEVRSRALLTHSDNYEEWGVSGLVRVDPGAAGSGLAFSVRPAWGQTASAVQRLWENAESGGAALADRAGGRVNARIAYGFGTLQGFQGVLTPYTDVSLSESGSQLPRDKQGETPASIRVRRGSPPARNGGRA